MIYRRSPGASISGRPVPSLCSEPLRPSGIGNFPSVFCTFRRQKPLKPRRRANFGFEPLFSVPFCTLPSFVFQSGKHSRADYLKTRLLHFFEANHARNPNRRSLSLAFGRLRKEHPQIADSSPDCRANLGPRADSMKTRLLHFLTRITTEIRIEGAYRLP